MKQDETEGKEITPKGGGASIAKAGMDLHQ